jgi:hypothetical protein
MRKLLPLLALSFSLPALAQTAPAAQTQPLICIRVESTSPLIHEQTEDLADYAVRAVNGNEHVTAVKIAGPTSDVHARAVERGCTHLLEMTLRLDRGSVSVSFNEPKYNPLDPTQADRNARFDERRLDLTYVATPISDSHAKLEGETFRKVQIDAAGPGLSLQDKLHEVTESSARVAVRKMKKKWKL